ncbi:MAG: hypothetical protein ACWA40_00130 [Planktomarina sp.]
MPHSWSNRLWLRFMYVLCIAVILWLQTQPSGVEARYFNPDLILALTLSWALYRPDVLQPILVGTALLCADFILQKPPGLWAALVVLGTVFLRGRKAEYDHRTFIDTWVLLSIVTICLFVLYNFVLRVTFSPAPSFMLGMAETISTCMTFPLIHIISAQVFQMTPNLKKEVHFR